PGVVICLLPFRRVVAAGMAGADMAPAGSLGPDSVRHDGIGSFSWVLVRPELLRFAQVGSSRLVTPAGPARGRAVRALTWIRRHHSRIPRPGRRARWIGVGRVTSCPPRAPPEGPDAGADHEYPQHGGDDHERESAVVRGLDGHARIRAGDRNAARGEQ